MRADSRFYRVLLKLQGMHVATGSEAYSVLLAQLYLGCGYPGGEWTEGFIVSSSQGYGKPVCSGLCR